MQTFLPYADFQESVRVLDRQRLGKQRVECLQILNALECGPFQKLNGDEGLRFFGDPSGNNDSYYQCQICGKIL